MRMKKTLIVLFLLLLVVPNLFISASNSTSHGRDFRIFLVAGERLLQGTPLYEGSGVATNFTLGAFVIIGGLLYCIALNYGNENHAAKKAS
jgi:hypothetical protein